MDPDAKKMLQAASRFSYIGIFFGVAILIGYFGGHWLDEKLDTDPWLSISGLIIGVVTGFRELIRLAQQAMKDPDFNGPDPRDPSDMAETADPADMADTADSAPGSDPTDGPRGTDEEPPQPQ